eukprot:TRINITY_DN27160_c0_g9_i1.p1 TRINITY_DN27160_c0_g9~~TRINITY_DN27160_c0_g9_i1.p1  ORF type:complete len:312 (-),score=93.11 TRINITY_DN27160_c0_g9_i1:89-1024(-)
MTLRSAARAAASAASSAAPAAVRGRPVAVALDMDGTTLDSQHALTPRTIAAIRRADRAGLRVIIATGRPSPALQPYVSQLALPGPLPVVCFNGALAGLLSARQEEERAPLFLDGLSNAAAREVLAVCARLGLCSSVWRAKGAVAAPQTEAQELQLQRFEALEGVKQERLPSIANLLGDQGAEDADAARALKVVALADDPEASAAEARAALPDGLVHVIAAEQHVEFVSPHVSKGAALARLCEALGVSVEEVAAFGDNHNDVEMLRLVGDGVAMQNAKESVKAAANRVSAWTNDDEGVARELEAFLEGMPAA